MTRQGSGRVAPGRLERGLIGMLGLLAGLSWCGHASHAQGQSPTSLQSGPLDLTWEQLDDNGFPLSPRWRWQETHPAEPLDPKAFPNPLQKPPNTFQNPTLDEARGFNAFVCRNFYHPEGGVTGHINWSPATYRGTLSWFQHAADGDYHLYLKPRGAGGTPILNGLTKANQGEFVVEFDSDETILFFKTPWWKRLRQTVDTDHEATEAKLNGRDTVISGLFGIDAEHQRHSELHPVWSFAVHAEDPAPNRERWAVFARNWGNEGYCSSQQHYAETPGNRMSVLLPWRPGATGVRLRDAEFAGIGVERAEPEVTLRPGAGLLLTFSLAAPRKQSSVHGECTVEWLGGSGLLAQAAPPVKVLQKRELEEEPGDTEEFLRELIEGLTPEQRARYQAQLREVPLPAPRATLDFRARRLKVRTLRVSQTRLLASPLSRLATTQSEPDPEKRERDRQRVEALRRALGGNLPLPATRVE